MRASQLACFGLCAALLAAALPPAGAASCQNSMESKINSQFGGTKQRASFRAGATYSIRFSDATSMEALIMVTDGGWLGSSSFKVSIYRNGALEQQYSNAYSCFEVSRTTLGYCPEGGSGEIVLKCNNWIAQCPIYFYKDWEDVSACPRPSPSPSPSPTPSPSPSPAAPAVVTPSALPPTNTTCDPATLMNDVELYGGALSVDGVPAVQSVEFWEECCVMCADVPECRAWTFQPSSSVCGGPCCMLKGEGYGPMPSKGAVSGA